MYILSLLVYFCSSRGGSARAGHDCTPRFAASFGAHIDCGSPPVPMACNLVDATFYWNVTAWNILAGVCALNCSINMFAGPKCAADCYAANGLSSTLCSGCVLEIKHTVAQPIASLNASPTVRRLHAWNAPTPIVALPSRAARA